MRTTRREPRGEEQANHVGEQAAELGFCTRNAEAKAKATAGRERSLNGHEVTKLDAESRPGAKRQKLPVCDRA